MEWPEILSILAAVASALSLVLHAFPKGSVESKIGDELDAVAPSVEQAAAVVVKVAGK